VAILLVGGLALAIVARTEWAHEHARLVIETEASKALGGQLRIGALRGSFWGELHFADVAITQDGEPAISASTVRVRYQPWRVFTTRVVDGVVLEGLTVNAVETAEGWNLARLGGADTATDPAGAEPSIEIDRLEVRSGTVHVQPLDADPTRLDQLSLLAGLSYRGRRLEIDLDRLTARETHSGVTVRQLSGDFSVGGGLVVVDDLTLATDESRVSGDVTVDASKAGTHMDVRLEAAPISLAEIAAYLPAAARLPLTPHVIVSARGSLAELDVEFEMQSRAGRFTGAGRASVQAESAGFKGEVHSFALDLAPWLGRPELESRITARASIEATMPRVQGGEPSVTFRADARDVSIAGYEASSVEAAGSFTGGVLATSVTGVAYRGTVAADVRWTEGKVSSSGAFRGVDVQRLPRSLGAPPLETNLAGRYALTVTGASWSADATLDRSAIAGGAIEPGTTLAVTSRAGTLSYRARGRALDIDPARLARALPAVPAAITNVPGRITASFALQGRGTTLADADATVDLALTDSSVAGVAVPALEARASLANRRLIADVRADFSDATHSTLGLGDDVAFATGGMLRAHVDLPDVNAPNPLERAVGQLTAELGDTTVRGVPLRSVALDASLAENVVQVRRLALSGREVHVTAKGPFALAAGARSDLAYEIDISNLALFGDLAKTPLEGGVHLAGRLTGGYPAIATAGHLRAHSLLAGPVRALSLEGKYDVSTGDLSAFEVDAVRAAFDGGATFVEAGGTRIDRVTARGTYESGTLDVQATLDEGARTLTIAGSLVPHPDHREVHIRDLVFATAGAEFRMAGGRNAVVLYGPDRVAVRDFVVVGRQGRIAIEGELGRTARADAALVVTIERVPVEAVNRVLLGSRRLTGTIDATARLEGAFDAPRVSFDGAVTDGAVDGVPYERLTAAGRYDTDRVALDVLLEAGPEGRLTASGTMPVRVGETAPAGAPPFDLRVESSALNVGLVQPLTTALEGIRGRGDIDLRITGPAKAPAIAGSIAIGDAGFTVPATGVAYSGLSADLQFEGNRMVVRQLRVEDDDGHVATISGGLNVSVTAAPTDFDLYLAAEDFHVLGNNFGELSVSADLHALGDLTTPLLVGTLEVDRARLEVDDWLDRFGSSGYARSAGNEPVTAAPSSSASFSIALAMPDNVVLRGRDLRATSGSFGLGDINVTLGGALVIAKESGQPVTLRGGLDVVRGQYAFQGRRFDIVRGSKIQFSGAEFLDPAIDVTAERRIGAVTANVRVTGTARTPEIALSSTPPLDQGDVLSLIVFNQPMNSLGATERVSLATRAGTLAARALATPIADSVARALDLDLFEIQPNEDAGTGATITVGRQLNDRLFVGFRQDFGSGDVSQVSFEYRLNEFLRIVTSFAQGADRARSVPRAESAGIDLFYVIRRE